MQIATFDETSEKLDHLDDWLMSLGISSQKGRWHQAALTVQRARNQRENIERGGQRGAIPNYVPGLFEAMEMYEIMRAFRGDSSEALKAKLSRALRGPISPYEEQIKNSGPRNSMFELLLAADWKNGGADVELGEPDVRLRLLRELFLVECKRPFRQQSVRKNIEDAASQLGKELKKPENKTAFGVVAISLSRVVIPGNFVCFAPLGEGVRVINEALDETIQEHWLDWRVKDFRNFHNRIVAVMFHLAAPWDIRGERLIHLSTTNFVETGNSTPGLRILSENLPKVYRAYRDPAGSTVPPGVPY
jgi:hypothetical protein